MATLYTFLSSLSMWQLAALFGTCYTLVAASPFPAVGSVTCSIGVAQLSDSESFEAWLARADEALYRAKAAGRNKVSVAGAVSEGGPT